MMIMSAAAMLAGVLRSSAVSGTSGSFSGAAKMARAAF